MTNSYFSGSAVAPLWAPRGRREGDRTRPRRKHSETERTDDADMQNPGFWARRIRRCDGDETPPTSGGCGEDGLPVALHAGDDHPRADASSRPRESGERGLAVVRDSRRRRHDARAWPGAPRSGAGQLEHLEVAVELPKAAIGRRPMCGGCRLACCLVVDEFQFGQPSSRPARCCGPRTSSDAAADHLLRGMP